MSWWPRRTVSAGRPPEPGKGAETTSVGWSIDPSGLSDLLARLRTEYPAIPVYITENGMALDDVLSPDGTVADPRRIDYLERHFAAAESAIADGTDLRGYFVWSLMDNFEWALGYRPRFGIVYVDFATQRRIPKASALWFSRGDRGQRCQGPRGGGQVLPDGRARRTPRTPISER